MSSLWSVPHGRHAMRGDGQGLRVVDRAARGLLPQGRRGRREIDHASHQGLGNHDRSRGLRAVLGRRGVSRARGRGSPVQGHGHRPCPVRGRGRWNVRARECLRLRRSGRCGGPGGARVLPGDHFHHSSRHCEPSRQGSPRVRSLSRIRGTRRWSARDRRGQRRRPLRRVRGEGRGRDSRHVQPHHTCSELVRVAQRSALREHRPVCAGHGHRMAVRRCHAG